MRHADVYGQGGAVMSEHVRESIFNSMDHGVQPNAHLTRALRAHPVHTLHLQYCTAWTYDVDDL